MLRFEILPKSLRQIQCYKDLCKVLTILKSLKIFIKDIS